MGHSSPVHANTLECVPPGALRFVFLQKNEANNILINLDSYIYLVPGALHMMENSPERGNRGAFNYYYYVLHTRSDQLLARTSRRTTIHDKLTIVNTVQNIIQYCTEYS